MIILFTVSNYLFFNPIFHPFSVMTVWWVKNQFNYFLLNCFAQFFYIWPSIRWFHADPSKVMDFTRYQILLHGKFSLYVQEECILPKKICNALVTHYLDLVMLNQSSWTTFPSLSFYGWPLGELRLYQIELLVTFYVKWRTL